MGFFGLVGLSPEHGLMDISAEESQTKAFMAGVCDRVYGVFDSSKADRFALHPFVKADRVTALYTDAGMPARVVASWAEIGVPVHRAAVSSRERPGERDREIEPLTGTDAGQPLTGTEAGAP
jgi:DeoR family transcriptional regulator of aga operon